jgi:hypothetical protein
MSRAITLAILSDIHYASPAEQARGDDYEYQDLANPVVRHLIRAYRRQVWLRDPLRHNDLLDRFLDQVESVDHVIANGDYSCDSAFVGVMDDAACQSARECLGRLRARFGDRFRAILGDHDLGKFSFVGSQGGLRVGSFHRAGRELGLEPFWTLEVGNYVLMGVTSSLVALPVFEAEALPAEWPEWNRLRDQHLAEIRDAFAALGSHQKVILFCHDPTALPFLGREETIRSRLSQVEMTIVGHLHTRLILWESRLLAGMPVIGFLGHSVRRLSSALHEARLWRPFHVQLCPSLAGIELLKDGGFLTARLDAEARRPVVLQFHPVRR